VYAYLRFKHGGGTSGPYVGEVTEAAETCAAALAEACRLVKARRLLDEIAVLAIPAEALRRERSLRGQLRE
jgi:hypothetical protein